MRKLSKFIIWLKKNFIFFATNKIHFMKWNSFKCSHERECLTKICIQEEIFVHPVRKIPLQKELLLLQFWQLPYNTTWKRRRRRMIASYSHLTAFTSFEFKAFLLSDILVMPWQWSLLKETKLACVWEKKWNEMKKFFPHVKHFLSLIFIG